VARIRNFYAGPAALPTEVLVEARDELLEFAGSGVSVMETSHRSKEFDQVHNEAIGLVKELIGLDDSYHVLFLQGGASMQFAMVPMNLLPEGRSADYIVTGAWSQKAVKEAKGIGNVHIAADTETEGVFTAIPKQDQLDLDSGAAYCHLTSNNTIFGTQWSAFPDTGGVPIIADMSSDILSYEFDPKPFGLIYAGAQKNLGPSGVTLVIIRQDMLDRCSTSLPTMLSYKTHADKNSLYNTPPSFGIYLMNKVLNWIKRNGGVEGIEKINVEKAKRLYGVIDDSDGFYRNTISAEDRSKMNVVFRLRSEDLEKQFVANGLAAGFVGLKGHRSVGGIRVSIYNANGMDAVDEIVSFMNDFSEKKG
jgi:phosphoserine aminotransferase